MNDQTDSTEDIRFKGVPTTLDPSLVEQCWDFTDEVDAAEQQLHEAGKVIFHARLTEDPKQWEQRIATAQGSLNTVSASIHRLRELLESIKKKAPTAPPLLPG